MDITFDKGVAFICEGYTEKEFYLSLLSFLCRKHNFTLKKIPLNSGTEILYTILTPAHSFGIKFYVTASISGMPKSSNWFETFCYLSTLR